MVRTLFTLALSALLCALVAACEEDECETVCGDSGWYEDCEECADFALTEEECAEIWCED